MTHYAVYENPSDFPGLFVVRRWTINGMIAVPDVNEFCTGPTLESVRQQLPLGLTRLKRFENDDLVLVEVWL